MNPNPTVGSDSASPFTSVNMPLPHATALPPPPRKSGHPEPAPKGLGGVSLETRDPENHQQRSTEPWSERDSLSEMGCSLESKRQESLEDTRIGDRAAWLLRDVAEATPTLSLKET